MAIKDLPLLRSRRSRRKGIGSLLAVPAMGLAGLAALLFLPGVDTHRWLTALARRLRL